MRRRDNACMQTSNVGMHTNDRLNVYKMQGSANVYYTKTTNSSCCQSPRANGPRDLAALLSKSEAQGPYLAF